MNIILKISIKILNLLYFFFKFLPVQNKILFVSRQSNTPSIDIRMLSDKISEIHPDYKVSVLSKKIGDGILSKISYCFHILTQMYHLATSKSVVLDSYIIPVSVLSHRKSLLIIQMWHSVGTMKKFGYSILDMPEGSSSKIAHIMKMHANYDYILAASKVYKPHLAEGFNYPVSKIIVLPLPRVEVLADPIYSENVRKKITAQYPILETKENIVYVPTFRKEENNDFTMAVQNLINSVNYDRYNLIVKAHPLAELNLSNEKAIIDRDFSSLDMLFIADYVISDFSCIIYEAAIRKLPLYFYTYDYEKYLSTRDIYMDYKKEMPGPICSSAAETIRAIENNLCDSKDVEAFSNKYITRSSCHETEDIVNFIFNNLK